MSSEMVQDLASFRLPPGFRGRPGWYVQLWWLVQALLIRPSPQFAYGWRRLLLRSFGARIGTDVLIRPTVRVTYPWKVRIDDRAWIGDHVELYSLGPIEIGEDAVVSQGSYLCTGSHDHRKIDFPIYAEAITIHSQAWVAARSFIGPGVSIGRGAVVGACSVVLEDVADLTIVAGHPARVIGQRAAS